VIRPRAHVAAMAAYALADPIDARTVSLAQNESAFAPSPQALEAGRAAFGDARLYPDPDWRELRAAIAHVHGLDADALLCGAGSMELIGALVGAFAGEGDEVLGSEHGYLFVATAAMLARARYVTAPERELAVSVDALLAAVTARTRIVVLCNPGNPSGTRIANAEIVRLREALAPQALLVVDQAYAEFDEQDQRSVFALVARGDTVVLRTFSKAYALAGARVGWGLFPAPVAQAARKLLNPNNISGVSQAMAAAAMRDRDWTRRIVERTASRRDAFAEALRTAGYRVPESHTNFVLIRLANAAAATEAERRLRAAGVMPRVMGGYGLSDCLRVTIGPEEAMARALVVLTERREGGEGERATPDTATAERVQLGDGERARVSDGFATETDDHGSGGDGAWRTSHGEFG